MTVKRPDLGPRGAKVSKEWSDLYQWLDERLQQIADMQVESHKRIRTDMEKGFNDVFAQARAISEDTRKNADATLVIQTERSMERRAGMKVGAIYGAIAGAVSSAIMAAVMRAVFE